MELTAFKTDENLVSESQWFDYEDGKLLVAREGNRKYQNELTRLTAGMFMRMRSGAMSQEQADKLDRAQKKAAAQFILLDWEGFTKGGKPVKYSPEIGYRAFLDFHSLFQTIQEFSQQVGRDTAAAMEDAAKNSANSSDG